MKRRLPGTSVLVLEPDLFMRGYVGAALVKSGAQLICLAENLDKARTAMAENRTIEVALLGVADAAIDHWTFAGQLAQRGTWIIFMFARPICIPSNLCGAPHLLRPFAAFQAVEEVASLIENAN